MMMAFNNRPGESTTSRVNVWELSRGVGPSFVPPPKAKFLARSMAGCRCTLLAALVSVSAALLIAPLPVARPALARNRVPQLSTDDDFPSDDYSGEAAPVPEMAATAPVSAETLAEISRLKQSLLALAAACNRGEAATASDLAAARTLVESLELLNPIAEPTLAPEVQGTWDLVFSDTQLFRSSPFFMAGRAVCEDGQQADQYDWFCDMHRAALAVSTIGKVRQVVDGQRLVSEFEVQAGAVPFLSDYLPLAYSGGLPVKITGSIVSTATIEANLGTGYRLLMDTVEIKGSNLPGLRQALDAGVKLQSRQLGSALESVVPTYANPQPLFRTSFLDSEGLRISRDQDGKVFVYAKQSDSTEPTDYSEVTSDLGVASLLQGVASTLFGN